jgi:hypothetical protein
LRDVIGLKFGPVRAAVAIGVGLGFAATYEPRMTNNRVQKRIATRTYRPGCAVVTARAVAVSVAVFALAIAVTAIIAITGSGTCVVAIGVSLTGWARTCAVTIRVSLVAWAFAALPVVITVSVVIASIVVIGHA